MIGRATMHIASMVILRLMTVRSQRLRSSCGRCTCASGFAAYLCGAQTLIGHRFRSTRRSLRLNATTYYSRFSIYWCKNQTFVSVWCRAEPSSIFTLRSRPVPFFALESVVTHGYACAQFSELRLRYDRRTNLYKFEFVRPMSGKSECLSRSA